MRAIAFTPLFVGLTVSAALGQQPSDARLSCVPKDHYDPGPLTEFALERSRAGDASTAHILLERAARISPGDSRVARAWSELAGAAAAAPPPERDARRETPPPVPSPPPPLWPAK